MNLSPLAASEETMSERFRALVFDAYGTLFDFHAAGARDGFCGDLSSVSRD